MGRAFIIADSVEKNNILLYKRIKTFPENLSRDEKKIFKKKCNKIIVKNGDIYINENNIEKKILLRCEVDLREIIISEKHSYDHARDRATYNRVRENYAGIIFDGIKNVLSRCIGCARETALVEVRTITPIIPNYPRERLIVDTIDLSVYADENDGFRYVFTLVDSFSKYAWCYPSFNKNAESFSKILTKHFYKEGVWSIFHSDNGGEFVNNLVNQVLENFSVNSVRGRPYHPQSQGQVERFNRTLKSRLRKCFSNGESNWISHIDKVTYFYNNNVHRATSMKPFVPFKACGWKRREIL